MTISEETRVLSAMHEHMEGRPRQDEFQATAGDAVRPAFEAVARIAPESA